ncbi:hypothetical protein M0805_005044 [Coniferiporia weirii]|nr:hypothetical protein M0805_005044 [Coniferiporia weirii]
MQRLTGTSEDYSKILEYGNSVLLHLTKIRGRTVSPISRSDVLAHHAALRVADSVRKPAESEAISYIFHRVPCVSTPLADLKKIYIEELRWCEPAHGRVLVVRTITTPREFIATSEGTLHSVVEDEHGAVHNLHVHNIHYGRNVDCLNVLPAGAVLAIKEPYCEAAKESTSGIRVDHPSDLLYLTEGDSLYPESWKTALPEDLPNSASERLKDLGNDAFKNKLYRTAIYFYSEGLRREHTPALKISLLLNRAQASLQLGVFGAAADDAEQVVNLSGSQKNEKALFRGARALYALGRFSDALKYLEQLVAAFPQNREAKTTLAKTKQRVGEQEDGKYDWISLVNEARKPSPRADVADYIGPVILSDGILVAKKSVKAGDLLICSKAFEVLYPHELKDEERALVCDVTKGVIGYGEGWKLTQKIAVKLLDNPAVGDPILGLGRGLKVYDGENTTDRISIVDGRPLVDINLLNTIRESYVIPFPAIHPFPPSATPAAQGLGIWPLGPRAHLKHSCLPNAVRSFLADVLILRACRDIPRGAPITISHVLPTLPLEERRAELSQPPGEICSCSFCRIEEEEGSAMRQRRVDLVQRVKELSMRAPSESLRTDAARNEETRPDDAVVREVTREVLLVCDALEASFTRPACDEPRFPLLEPLAYLFACHLYLGTTSTEDAVRTNARYLASLGFSFEYTSPPDAAKRTSGGGDVTLVQHGFYHPFVVKTLVQQSSVCWQLGKKRTAESWKRIAENAMEIIGGHRRLFKEGYSKVYESLSWDL